MTRRSEWMSCKLVGCRLVVELPVVFAVVKVSLELEVGVVPVL